MKPHEVALVRMEVEKLPGAHLPVIRSALREFDGKQLDIALMADGRADEAEAADQLARAQLLREIWPLLGRIPAKRATEIEHLLLLETIPLGML
jgi:hypothetical protein